MKNFFQSKLGTLVLMGLFVSVVFAGAKALSQKYQTDKQVRQLQARTDQIKSDNSQLSDLVNYLGTTQYQEKAAREQLNLKKPGEVVVGLPQDQPVVAAAATTVQISNSKKWYDYFFKPDATN